jgi:acetyl esterase/lipase
MSRRDLIDPESLVPLDALLEVMPGGFNAIPDIVARRAAVQQIFAMLPVVENPDVVKEDRTVPGPGGDPDITIRIYRPVNASDALPGIYFIHGGGMVLGDIAGEDATAVMLCAEIGAVVVSVEYRLAPEHPHPAPVEDCYAGLVWTADNAAALGIDPDRMTIYGGSAGGGLALGTALLARDRQGPALRFVMPIYPMIDDTNTTASSHEITDVGIWDRAGNVEAWQWYLGGKPADQYAAPTRAADVSGLPSTYIDVGTVDLFRDEDIAFAQRLMQAGVACELHVNPGSYHGSETFAPDAALSRRIWATRIAALRRALP